MPIKKIPACILMLLPVCMLYSSALTEPLNPGNTICSAISPQQPLTDTLEKIMQHFQAVGMSVCVVENGMITYSRSFGLRDMERNLPVNENTKYRIASISKMFTTTALMQLYDKGLFKLNDDVSRYLGFTLRNPNFPNQVITFSRLLSHTSSLREGKGYETFLDATYSETPAPDLKTLLLKGEKYYTEDMWSTSDGPGTEHFSYANINFGIAGTLVEKLSGQRFDVYCREHILLPLGISGSFNVLDIPDINDMAVIYRKEDSTWVAQTDNYQGKQPQPRATSDYVPGTNGVIYAPQGGMRISAPELAKFMCMQMNYGTFKNTRILSTKAVKQMQCLVWKYNGKNGDSYDGFFKLMGLGYHMSNDLLKGKMLLGHSGDAYGLISDMYFTRDRKFGIIFITNGAMFSKGRDTGWYNMEEEVIRACYEMTKQ